MARSTDRDRRPGDGGDPGAGTKAVPGSWSGPGNRPDPSQIPQDLESRTIFGPWRTKAAGMVRDLPGAAAVLADLLPGQERVPAVVVTGSKGKGQAATTAAAHLSAAGLRTGLVTSPGTVSNLDRFALDGAVIGARAYAHGLELLEQVLQEHRSPEGTYLSPTGLCTVLGHALLARAGAEVIVHEAGMGGAGDEVSLFDPLAVGLARVFPEHLDVFGPTLEYVAREKFGLVHSSAPVVSVAQDPAVQPLLERQCRRHGASLETLGQGGCFLALNDRLGRALARAAVQEREPRGMRPASGAVPDPEATGQGQVCITRPGRGQLLQTDDGHPLVVDAAIDVVGLRQVLQDCRRRWGTSPRVLWSVPVTKNFREISQELDRQGLQHAFVLLDSVHLDYRLPSDWERRPEVLALGQALASVDGPTLAVGTVSFGAALLRQLGQRVERLYHLPR